VAETIAAQTELDAVKAGTASGSPVSDALEAALDTSNGAMTWAGNYSGGTTYHIGAVVYDTDGLFYVALRTTVNDTPASSGSDWRLIAPPSAYVPSASGATGSPHDMYVLANSSGNTWMDLEFAMQAVIADNTDMDNRYEEFYVDDSLPPSMNKGTPVRVFRTTAVKATGQDDSGNLTANTAIATSVYNGWMLYVIESPTGNRTNPVSVVDTPNSSVICTVPDTGLTTWNAIVTSWNAAQVNIVADLVTGNYDAATTTTGNSTILMGVDGVEDEQRITTINMTANAVEATVYGLYFSAGGPGEKSMIQTGGTMTFNATQTVNTFNNSTLDGGDLLVPGEPYYAATGRLENVPEAANVYCVPIGVVNSPTTLRLRLGLPVKTTVGA
jgi:hypothetical protein